MSLRQRLRKFFRINLRSALLLVAILSGFLAWATRDVHLAYRRARLISAVEALGGEAFGNEPSPPGKFSAANSIASFWDERLTGPVEFVRFSQETTDEDAARIARLIVPLAEVRSVSFGGAAITDRGVEPFAVCKQLRDISLAGTKITDAAAPTLARLTNLENLSLAQTAITDAALADLQSLPDLTTVDLSETSVTDAALVRTQAWPNLVTIRLNGTRVTDAVVRAIQRRLPELSVWVLPPRPRREALSTSARDPLPSLAQLAKTDKLLLDHPFFDDGSLARLSHCPHAKSLQLGTSRVTHVGLRQILYKDQITHLELADPSFDDRALAAIASFTAIEDLDLCDASITDEGLAHLAGLQNLRALRLSNTGISDAGIEHFADLGQLRTLWLGWTCVTDDGLRHLAGLAELRELGLVCTGIDGSGLAHLANLKRLEWLLLDATSLTDDGLHALPPLPELDRIDFDRTDVSDVGLEHLKSFPQLRGVVCRWTRITPAGMDSFQSVVRQRTLSQSPSPAP